MNVTELNLQGSRIYWSPGQQSQTAKTSHVIGPFSWSSLDSFDRTIRPLLMSHDLWQQPFHSVYKSQKWILHLGFFGIGLDLGCGTQLYGIFVVSDSYACMVSDGCESTHCCQNLGCLYSTWLCQTNNKLIFSAYYDIQVLSYYFFYCC